MTKKIAIVVDSGSDVPQSVLDENKNIAVVPLNITMNGHNYLDAVDITPDEFYSALATAETLPQTSSPSPQAAKEAMDRLFAAGYQQILGITISSALSVTNNVFQLAAQDFPADTVTILDTKSIGIGSGIQAAYAASLINAGESFSGRDCKSSCLNRQKSDLFLRANLEIPQCRRSNRPSGRPCRFGFAH